MSMTDAKKLEKHFEQEWKNPPEAFNPDYKYYATKLYAAVTTSMEHDKYYDNHTREECGVEWRKRYKEKFLRSYKDD